MMRGEVYSLRDRQYASKARPVVVVQSDKIDSFDSVILCLLTTYDSDEVKTRVCVKPSNENGLQKKSYVMTDKIVTVDRSLLGEKIGVLSEEDMKRVSKQLRIVLGL